jgi:type II secretory pathway pseudopilin PulG
MVVLVIASIIGIALFSRISKSRQAAIDQQNSNSAVETADSLLDILVGANIENIEANLPQEGLLADGTLELLFQSLSIDEALIPELSEWCPGNDPESKSSLKLSVREAEAIDFPEIAPGSVRAYNFQDVTVDPGCSLNLYVKGSEGISVFIVKQVFEEKDPVVNNYCVDSSGGEDCATDTIPDIDPVGSLSSAPWKADKNYYALLPFDLINLVNNEGLAEIRVLPILGTIGVNNSDISGCAIGKSYKSIKITAEANCNGTYRAKQMFLPGSGNLGYSTLFDYGIYDNGLFQP